MDVPAIPLDLVYHVGSLDGRREGTSYEGKHLSVSWCPDGWTRIARLGGRETHEFRRPGGRFLDVTALDGARRAALAADAVAEGLLLPATLYRAEREDDEIGGTVYTEHETRGEALDEIDGDEDPQARIAETSSFVATPALLALAGFAKGATGDFAVDLAVMVWAERLGFDGAWWRETYQPEAYSAPRGCVFLSALPSWTRGEAGPVDDDETLLEAFPETRTVPSGSLAPAAPRVSARAALSCIMEA